MREFVQNINKTNIMLWKSDLDTHTNSRADAKHVWKENIAKNMVQHKRGDAGVPDGTVNCTVYTRSQTPWRTLKSED